MTAGRSALALAAALALGCAAQPLKPYVPRKRDYQMPPAASQAASPSPGSLWRDGLPAALLFTDARALREHDLVVVKVEEVANARRTSETDLKHTADHALEVTAFLEALATAKTPAGVKTANTSTFAGHGSTARTERLTATVPALVRKVLPNGNLFIEGHRAVLVNDEEQQFYISGVVRPIDIDGENSVKSSMLADAEVEFTGRGIVSDNQRKGWLARRWGWLWPF